MLPGHGADRYLDDGTPARRVGRQGLRARSALDLATDVGLSGPGRLHDLFVRLEAMSPGEFKSVGAGLRIGFGTYESPFGPCFIASTARGVCALRFLERATGNRAQGRDPRLGSRAR